MIQFGQFSVDVAFVKVFRPIGPEPGRYVVLPDILAGQYAVMSFIGPTELVERALVIAPGATDFLGWAGPAATHTYRVVHQRGRRQHFLDPHLVLPVIAEVIGIGKLVIDPPREIAQVNPAGIAGKIDAARIRNPVFLASKFETVQMPVFPAHRYLKDVMQLSQRRVAPHQHAPIDVRADAQQMNLELVDRRQAVIADGGGGSNRWEHGFHR